MLKTRLKTGDTVKVISGKDKGKEGKILSVDRKSGKVIVEGVNMVTKHTKPSAANQQGGIIHQEAPVYVSKVMYVHKGKPTRLGVKLVKEDRNGRTKNIRYRVAKSTGEVID
ncbi:MAG: 50S ribosomal protein L24 [Vallitalea sp.]|nr:50S ribosomal protein L24 [Vallitalea sp.]